jgi:hypothetical protein
VDVWKRSAEVANIASGTIAVYLLLKPQAASLVSEVPSRWPDRLPLVILCVSVVGAAVLNVIALQRKPAALIEPTAAADRNETAVPSGPTTAHASRFDAQTVLPDGRAIISCTQEDIVAAYRDNTIDQFHRLLSGKWIKISAKIEDNRGKGKITLMGGIPYFNLQFKKGWEEQLAVLKRGSSVTVRGRVVEADPLCIRFDECELL